MKTLGILLGLSVSTLSLSAFAADEFPYEMSCSTIEYVVEELNESLQGQVQFNLDCQETYDSMFWGAIKNNFRSKINMTATVPLCSSKIGVTTLENSPVLDYPVKIGMTRYHAEQMLQFFYEHGIEFKVGAMGTNVGTMYEVRQMRLPICE